MQKNFELIFSNNNLSDDEASIEFSKYILEDFIQIDKKNVYDKEKLIETEEYLFLNNKSLYKVTVNFYIINHTIGLEIYKLNLSLNVFNDIKCNSNDYNIKYLKVEKMTCINKEFKLTHRTLETIVEVTSDYSKILRDKIPEEISVVSQLNMKLKSEECEKISNCIAKEINYCKECKAPKKENLMGLGEGAFEQAARKVKSK